MCKETRIARKKEGRKKGSVQQIVTVNPSLARHHEACLLLPRGAKRRLYISTELGWASEGEMLIMILLRERLLMSVDVGYVVKKKSSSLARSARVASDWWMAFKSFVPSAIVHPKKASTMTYSGSHIERYLSGHVGSNNALAKLGSLLLLVVACLPTMTLESIQTTQNDDETSEQKKQEEGISKKQT